ncbi:MoaD/ThiS family protein [Derxia gummosa]|uniref:Molybdopterin synthase sulfur carrier subunit n=1 Tax=Derxia gummosa DSM 723 TaxID=1121388 RepID=A0A8B6X349_9BURK|nr:MoaD/ThiS family protein [Derxia gummosa]
MKIRILYFAALRDALDRADETLDTTAATLADLRAELAARGGAWAERFGDASPAARRVKAAVDQTMATPDTPLRDGAEVAFFPPVTGG